MANLKVIKELHRGTEYIAFLCEDLDTGGQVVFRSSLTDTVEVTNRENNG
jgi:hypothetical protein